MSLKYNKSDVAHAQEIFLRLRDEMYETGSGGEYETAMFSFGYADVSTDGEVVAYGRLVFALDDDGDLVETDDGDSEE